MKFKLDEGRKTPKNDGRISDFQHSDLSKPSPRRVTPHPIKTVNQSEKDDPSFYREFVECSSKYELQLKEDSEEISDNAEFDDARHLKTYDQEATEVLNIEHQNEVRGQGKYSAFNAKQAKAAGVKSKRDKDFKHFTDVGYIGQDDRPIPRWAVDQNKLKEVLKYQSKTVNPLDVFGKFRPKVVETHFKLEQIFSKGNSHKSYM